MDPKRIKTQHVYQSRFAPYLEDTPAPKKPKLEHPTGMTSSDPKKAKQQQFIGSKQLIERTKYVRLLEQTLTDLGFEQVGKELERVSGIACESELVGELRVAVEQGQWQRAVEIIGLLGTEGNNFSQALMLIYQHQYAEAVQKKDWDGALQCLRQRLSELDIGQEKVRQLSMLCLTQANTSSQDQTQEWPGTDRQVLVNKLQELIPHGQMLPAQRLEILLERALDEQLSKGLLLKDPCHSTVSLLEDVDGTIQLPQETIKVLSDHQEQVWHVEFSHKGDMLASASCDGVLIIYEVQGYGFNLLHRLQHASYPPPTDPLSYGIAAPHQLMEHLQQQQTQQQASQQQQQQQSGQNGQQQSQRQERMLIFNSRPLAITALSWSPDDKYILTGGFNYVIRVWNSVEGQLVHTLMGHTHMIHAIAWVSNDTFLSTSQERKMVLWNVQEGRPIQDWVGRRGYDMVVTPQGKYCLYAEGQKLVVMDVDYNGEWMGDASETKFNDVIFTVTLSSDGEHLLVCLRNKQLLMYRLNYGSDKLLGPEPLKEFLMPSQPPEQSDTVIRQCFGGVGQKYVASGSLENKVYLWEVNSAEFLSGLKGHTNQVNDVSWNPQNPLMLASGSDDKTVRIWGVQEYVEQWRLRMIEKEDEQEIMNGSTSTS